MYSDEWTDRQRPITTATLPFHRRYTNSLARPACSARQRFAYIHRDSASLRYCAPVSTCPALVLASFCCRTRPCRPSPIRRSSHAAARPLYSDADGRRFRQLRT